ncbi:TonB-dependent hemoglobin/transferrin/lactoferrin family receptor [Pasteurellaceae bacterium LIM206]|nr:TonB-dependent hemoglobin/transferrin/lactoferrin family receptor [Pasteurellaceae bacterium LIM206]
MYITLGRLSLSLFTLAILTHYSPYALSAETVTEELKTIDIHADNESGNIIDEVQNNKVGETVKTAKALEKQQVQDSKDLVRYETGITVVENGRFGNSGFAIRGVDENRVAIQIDGLAQAEAISSQGFKELFEGYGNFNNTRNSAEIETLKQVTIRKGADSIKTGSGSLGGSVSFETKDARDYLLEKNYHFGYKRGYSTADNQNLESLSFAGRYKWFDVLVVDTHRKGHEIENYGYKTYDPTVQGKTREKADPYNKKLHSTLLKFSFQPSDNHRFTAMADLYKNTTRGHDFSYTLKPNTKFMTYDELELRHTNDKIERKNYAFSYENYSANPLWDTLKLSYSHQKIVTRARTDDYCDGNLKCPLQTNPLGMKYNENNELVGRDGKLAEYYNNAYAPKPQPEYKDIETSPYDGSTNKYKWQRVDWEKLEKQYPDYEISHSCDDDKPGDNTTCKVEMRKKLQQKEELTINNQVITPQTLDEKGKHLLGDEQRASTDAPLVLSCEAINCDLGYIYGFSRKGEGKVKIPFNVFERDGKKYAQTEQQAGGALKSPILLLPNKLGYIENIWTERDLITTTDQVNLDLTKYLELGPTQHDISYGGSYAESKKEMVNKTGVNAIQRKWWVLYPKDCNFNNFGESRYSLCNPTDTYSFLIPVKTKTGALYFADDVKVNDYIGFSLAYRYDRIKHKPEYIPGVTPKIPDGLVNNMYETEPRFDPFNFTDPDNLARKRANAEANIKRIAQPKKFSASSYALGINLDPLTWLRVQAKYSKGFRAPTSDEIYFTFKHPDFSIIPNKDLESETAKTKEVAFTLYKDFGFITTSVFQTRYNNFIDLVYQGTKQLEGHSILRPYYVYQNVNRQNAKVNGVEINSKLHLRGLSQVLNGFHVSYKYTYQKGRVENDIPMNAIQPRTAVYGIGYNHPEDKFGFDVYVTHAAAKEAKDTYNMYYKEEGKKDSTVKWRSQSYTLIDAILYVKPFENFTIRAGVYNLTNRKYATWDSIRSIRPFGTSNMIDQNTGLGLNRFNAPGRNYKLTAELTF